MNDQRTNPHDDLADVVADDSTATPLTATASEADTTADPEDDSPDLGATTAEYGIVMLAAVGFAGLLVVILKSGEVKEMLLGIIRTALSAG